MVERVLARWRGVLLSLFGTVAICWLGVTGRLGLYIHPRYFVFSLVMAGIAFALTIVAFAAVPLRDPDDGQDVHDHDVHDDGRPADAASDRPAARTLGAVLTVGLALGALVALLVLPPATLSAAVQQRGLPATTTAVTGGGNAPAHLASGDFSRFTVRDWSNLLRSGVDADYLSDKPADLTGFVVPDPHDPKNVFYLSRLVITCCAVDAQPLGVPVYVADWPARFSANQWLHVTGTFRADPSTSSLEDLAIVPSRVDPAAEPSQPYVY